MILIDTGPLVALCDRADGKHRAAVTDLQELSGETFATCEAVLTEACFHLPHATQRRRLRMLLEAVQVSALSPATEPGAWVDTFDWIDTYADHEPDWADACIATLSGRDQRLRVWTYDREFTTTWRRMDGSTLPLALVLEPTRTGARSRRRSRSGPPKDRAPR
jgi:predicted nucleic acid-binding protein